MHRVVEDHAKRRLIDKIDIATAILAMSAKGVPAERLLPELMKVFYVDLDEYNEVVSGKAVAHAPQLALGSFAA